MGFFNKKNKRKPSKDKWPLKPPRHEADRNFLLNEFDTYGAYMMLGREVDPVKNQITNIHLYIVLLMENGYGERYCNVLKNGLITRDTSGVRQTDDWRKFIDPWLKGETDHIPIQDGIVAAELSKAILEFRDNQNNNSN